MLLLLFSTSQLMRKHFFNQNSTCKTRGGGGVSVVCSVHGVGVTPGALLSPRRSEEERETVQKVKSVLIEKKKCFINTVVASTGVGINKE